MLAIYPAFLEFQEIMIILVVAVVIFGPDKIPEIARGLGQAVRKMKEATEDIKQEIMNPVSDLDPTKEIRNSISDLDPTKELNSTIKGGDPINEIARALEDPIKDIEKTLLEQNTNSDSTNPAKEVEKIIEVAKTETEVKAEEELGNGGSISR